MDNDRVQQLEELLKMQPDDALLQYSLGLEYLKRGDAEKAISPLGKAIRLQSDYSAAYRELGKALTQTALAEEAVQTYQQGIEVAQGRGDLQTAKEMEVFLRRITKSKGEQSDD